MPDFAWPRRHHVCGAGYVFRGSRRAQDLPGVSRGWRATFYVSGREYGLTSTVGGQNRAREVKALGVPMTVLG